VKIAELNGQVVNLENKKQDLRQEEDKLDKAKASVRPLKSQEAKLVLEHTQKQDQLDKLQQTEGRVRELDNQIPDVRSQKKEKEKEQAGLAKELDELDERVKNELLPAIEKASSKKRPTAKTKAQIKKERVILEKQAKAFQKKKGALEQQAKNFTQLIKEGKCPVCMRPLSRGDFGQNLRHVQEEEELLRKKLEGAEKKVEEYNHLEELLVEFEHAQETLTQLGRSLNEAKTRIDKIARQKVPEATEAVQSLGEKLNRLIEESKKLETVTDEINALAKERDEIGRLLKTTTEELGSVQNQIQQAQTNIEKLTEEIQGKEDLLSVKVSLDEHRNWIGDYFSPTVETIERHVMIAIWEKMDEQFQRWFQVLIEDPNLQSKIDQDFNPIVTQNGYDQDFESLSGGEKTSVALAYRLALNSTVREISTGVKPNLLILDEPTDGFSKEQLFKIRDLIAELKCPQTIIVSHEEELDTCADHIFHVERVGGVSTVSAIR
jgi:exonuclease SbcC